MPRPTKRRYFKELRIQQLQGFCETARSGSFAVAAETLSLSRPALWHQIRALERELGADLVRRHGRGIEVTPDGTLLLELAEPLVTGFARLKTIFHERRGVIARHVTLASNASLLANELREPLHRFRSSHPDVQLTLVDRTSLEAARLIETGEADLAVVGRCDAEPLSALVTCEPLFTEPFVLICPRNHELTRRRRVPLDLLIRFPCVLLAKETITRRQIERVLHQHGLLDRLNVVVDTTNYDLVLDYVAAGLGISVLVSGPDLRRRKRLHVRSATDWFGEETTVLLLKKGTYHSPHLKALEEIIRQSMTQMRT